MTCKIIVMVFIATFNDISVITYNELG